ncbi:hypothetical protein KSS87_001726 [Heliosperma pusillum]|nr:hypothetical protein KSS87_017780 [Heliosperma pusillum]KAH9622426.1 hypothetical protein KSS87_001726 [Heliosperma pusillum]
MRTQMLRSAQNALKRSSYGSLSTRAFSSSSNPERKVTILGAAGGIGQPLSLLMKTNPLVSKLSLFDLAATPGVAADVSHIPTRALVKGYERYEQLDEALEGSDVVIIPAGVPRKPGMTRDDLFAINAGIVKGLCEAIAKYCPNALVNMISNPVNSTVPIAAEVFKKAGTYDPKRCSCSCCWRTRWEDNSAIATPQANLSPIEIIELTQRTQHGGTEVVTAKAGKGSATLSMAFAGAVFADACLKGLNGVPDVIECSYVQSEITKLAFFASKVRLGKNGVEEIMGLGSLSDAEKESLKKLLPELQESIEKGIEFVKNA